MILYFKTTISYTFPRALEGQNKVNPIVPSSNIQVAAIAGMSGSVRIGSTRHSLVPSSLDKNCYWNVYRNRFGSLQHSLVDGSKIRLEENTDSNQQDSKMKVKRYLSRFISFETDVSRGQRNRTDGEYWCSVQDFRVVAKENTENSEADTTDIERP